MSELNVIARYPYVALPAAFTPAELDAIENLGDSLTRLDASTTVNDGKNLVNRSRITQVARPGSLLADREVRESASEDYRWSYAGERRLRGVREPVSLFRARRLDA